MDEVEDIVFGSIAGVVGKIIEYPFDTVKVRLQSQPDHLPLRYAGPIDCFKQSIQHEGIIHGLYRGVSAPLVGAALETSSLFFWERLAQKSFYAAGLYPSAAPLPLEALFATGAISGAFTSLILTPIELVKCKMQVPLLEGAAPRSVSVIITHVYRQHGLAGFWSGQMGTLIRETGGCAAWFGSKESVTQLFRRWDRNPRDPLPFWQQAVAGASAGVSYNFLFYPADTIKSRMQTMSGRPDSFWREGVTLWRQHGIKGMYRGCGITALRSAPSSAFIFTVFDGLKYNFHLETMS